LRLAPMREQITKKITMALGVGACWIVDDSGFPKQSKYSVGVVR